MQRIRPQSSPSRHAIQAKTDPALATHNQAELSPLAAQMHASPAMTAQRKQIQVIQRHGNGVVQLAVAKEKFLPFVTSQYNTIICLEKKYGKTMGELDTLDFNNARGLLYRLKTECEALGPGADAQALVDQLKDWQNTSRGLGIMGKLAEYKARSNQEELAAAATAERERLAEEARNRKPLRKAALKLINKAKVDAVTTDVRAARKVPGQGAYNAGRNDNETFSGGTDNPVVLDRGEAEFEFTMKDVSHYTLENSDSGILKVRTPDGIFVHCT